MTSLNVSVGVGLRHPHFPELETQLLRDVDFFEIIAENFLHTRGRPWRMLERVRQSYPIAVHGVSLSIASVDPLDREYLKKLVGLVDEFDPLLVSDHLCWTGGSAHNLHNLLPFPYTEDALDHVAARVHHVQEILARPLVLENLSAYMSYKGNEMDEIEFMNRLCEKTGCGILLDINNLYVNSKNLNFDSGAALKRVNLKYVKQLHLAGHSDFGTHLFDTHSQRVQAPVWSLFESIAAKLYDQLILIEWDENIPRFDQLQAEAQRARSIMAQLA